MPTVTFLIPATESTPEAAATPATSQSVQVESGVRLTKALREHVDIGHRCGGKAGCTTCRVRYLDGEPARMTTAERDKLADVDLLGEVRLSCQILVEDDATVEVLMRQATSGWSETGPPLADSIEPEPVWIERPADHG